MRDANSLLADRVDSTTWYTGAGIVEDVNDLIAGFESGSWIDAGIGGLAASMDLLAVCTDPLGALASWGVAWLIEHVKPLSDALDWLAGDPDQITAYAQTWRNVSSAVASCASSFPPHPAGWAGAAADAYRSSALAEVHALEGMTRAAGGIALIVEGGGLLVALVRGLVRDLIAEFVSVLAVRLPEWLAEEACTLGVATPWVAAQVSALVGKWVAKVARLLHGLAASIRKLLPALRRLGELIGSLKAVLRDLHRSPAPAGPAVYPPDPVGTRRGLGADGPVLAESHDIPGSPRTVDAVTATTPDRPASPDFNNTSVLAPASRSASGSHGPGSAPASKFPSGAGWVQDADSPKAAETYRRVREATGDTPRIAASTGVQQEVVDRVKRHLFMTEHEVALGPNQTHRGYFSPLDEIANLWTKADSGTLSGTDAEKFRRLMAHEYVESRLMEEGMPYRSSHPDAYDDGVYWSSAEHHGAHDLAPSFGPLGGPFDHWPNRIGREPPDVTIAPDLSNLEVIVKIALQGWKG
jgi:hypothetical protein